jgi:hypothetical protein
MPRCYHNHMDSGDEEQHRALQLTLFIAVGRDEDQSNHALG